MFVHNCTFTLIAATLGWLFACYETKVLDKAPYSTIAIFLGVMLSTFVIRMLFYEGKL